MVSVIIPLSYVYFWIMVITTVIALRLLGANRKPEEEINWDEAMGWFPGFGIVACMLGALYVGRITVFGLSLLSVGCLSGLFFTYKKMGIVKPRAWRVMFKVSNAVMFYNLLLGWCWVVFCVYWRTGSLSDEPGPVGLVYIYIVSLPTIAFCLTTGTALTYHAIKNRSH